MRYSFVTTGLPFQRCSTLYNVYDNYENRIVCTIVVGYDILNKKFYFTEFRGNAYHSGLPELEHIQSFEQLCSILSDFSEIFTMMDISDIISGRDVYLEYQNVIPEVKLDNLLMYDSSGEVYVQGDEYILTVTDDYIDDLISIDAVDGQLFLLEELTDEYDDPLIDLVSDIFICRGDVFDGVFLFIKDWNQIKTLAEVYNN